MKYRHELMVNIINDNITDVSDLVTMLEISIEDVVERFPDKLKENWYKFVGEFMNNETVEDTYYDEED